MKPKLPPAKQEPQPDDATESRLLAKEQLPSQKLEGDAQLSLLETQKLVNDLKAHQI